MGPNPVAHSFTFVSDVRLYVRWVPRQCWRACPWMGLASLQLFCILICSMSFPPNLYDFHWILLSFDSKVLKRERSCQLVHRLQKSGCECVCVCVCVRARVIVCENWVTISHFWLRSSHLQPTLVLNFHSFVSFPFWSTSEGKKTSSYYYICTCQILCWIQLRFLNYSGESGIYLVQNKFSYTL